MNQQKQVNLFILIKIPHDIALGSGQYLIQHHSPKDGVLNNFNSK